MLAPGMLLVGHQHFVASLQVHAIRDVAVCLRSIAQQRNFIPFAADKRSQWIAKLVPRRIAPNRVILGIALRHFLLLIVAIEHPPQPPPTPTPPRSLVPIPSLP